MCFFLCSLFLLILFSVPANSKGLEDRYRFSFGLGSVRVPDRGYEKEDWLNMDVFDIGYSYKDRLEFGISIEKDDSSDSDWWEDDGGYFKHRALGAFARFTAIDLSVLSFFSIQIHAAGSLHYVDREYKYGGFGSCSYNMGTSTCSNYYAQGDEWYIRPGVSAGLDFAFGKQKSFIIGLEVGIVGSDIKNHIAASFKKDSYSGSGYYDREHIYLSWRFGKGAEKPKETPGVPLMNTINGLSESDWHSVMGGRSELDLGNYRPSGNFGGYGNAWFGN